jgi:hypothetical protein
VGTYNDILFRAAGLENGLVRWLRDTGLTAPVSVPGHIPACAATAHIPALHGSATRVTGDIKLRSPTRCSSAIASQITPSWPISISPPQPRTANHSPAFCPTRPVIAHESLDIMRDSTIPLRARPVLAIIYAWHWLRICTLSAASAARTNHSPRILPNSSR